MAIIELLDKKINDLKKNSQEELKRISGILDVIIRAQEALSDEKLLKNYDFSIAIKLVNSHSFGIIDLERIIINAKNVLIAKYDYKQSFLSLSSSEEHAIKSFNERLGYLKEELEKKVSELSKVKIDEETLENLESFKKLLEGKGRKKYYTYEMLESLFEVIPYDSLSYEDINELMDELMVSRNISGQISYNIVDFNDVISLFKEFFTDSSKFNLLNKYQNEICARIDLDNARSILEFFKEEKLLDRFSFYSLLVISIYGRAEYVKNIYCEKVMSKNNTLKELYFEDAMSGVWINEKSSKRRYNVNAKSGSKKDSVKTLYGTITEVCDDDVWENIRIIKENEDILSSKYDLSNIDYLWVITKPTWLIKKNIELFRIFNIHNVTLTSLVQNDLENKIHFVIELGLLNTPKTYIFRSLEEKTPRYQEFMLNGQRKNNNNDNILNYFSRNTSEIGKTTYTEYIYWFYKMQRSGKEEFYSNFFSSLRAGRRNRTDFYRSQDEDIISDNNQMDKIIADNFVTNYYDALIPDYDFYADTLKEYYNSSKGDLVNPYYDKSILKDEKVQELEEFTAIDIYGTSDEIKKVKNQFAYVFGDNIISRYKTLRNLSILKQKYGYLNDDMILTAVVYNSYINEETFNLIKNSVRKDEVIK